MNSKKIFSVCMLFCAASAGASEYTCLQDLKAEKGIVAFDAKLLSLEIKINSLPNGKMFHLCTLGKTGGGMGKPSDYGTSECEVKTDQIGATHVYTQDDELDGWINTDSRRIVGSGDTAEIHYRADVKIRWDNYKGTGQTKFEDHIFDCTDSPVKRPKS